MQSKEHSVTTSIRDEITFRGRGRAIRRGNRFVLKVCPECSQHNARQAADNGHCAWCAYVPSLDDAELVGRQG
nr:hypothetical protein [Methylobacterium sp. Leaf99]